jgi:hypothetical protein
MNHRFWGLLKIILASLLVSVFMFGVILFFFISDSSYNLTLTDVVGSILVLVYLSYLLYSGVTEFDGKEIITPVIWSAVAINTLLGGYLCIYQSGGLIAIGTLLIMLALQETVRIIKWQRDRGPRQL